jgi:predicted ATPase
MPPYHHLPSIQIKGYRPFKEIKFQFTPLQVLVGANGSGKSSLFEFLKFIRDACYQEIPPEIIEGSIGQQIFHKPGSDRFSWCAEIDLNQKVLLYYEGELMGPVGSTKVISERVTTKNPLNEYSNEEYTFLNFQNGKGIVKDPEDKKFKRKEWDLRKPNQLGLGAITDSTLVTLFNLREYVRGWRFYNSFHINNEKIRKSVPTSQEPVLHEDAGNLSAVLFNLMTEHPESFEELKSVIKSAIPGFKNLNVKARGGPGEVIAFWQEKAMDTDLSLADLSDGTLRFIAWATLCVTPFPPSLICIDEPDQGVHPRTLPILAGLFEKASQRTQVVLATHASYFLSQFDLKNVAVMKKAEGESVFVKVSDSRTLLDNLDDFGSEELEKMHRTDELEALA